MTGDKEALPRCVSLRTQNSQSCFLSGFLGLLHPSPLLPPFLCLLFQKTKTKLFIIIIIIFVIVRTKPRALHTLDKFFTTDLHPSHVGVLRSPFLCSYLESGTLSVVTPSLLLYFIQKLRWSHPPQHLGA